MVRFIHKLSAQGYIFSLWVDFSRMKNLGTDFTLYHKFYDTVCGHNDVNLISDSYSSTGIIFMIYVFSVLFHVMQFPSCNSL